MSRPAEWSVAERREARRVPVALGVAATVLALIAALSLSSGDTGLAALAGAGLMLGAFRVASLRAHGVWGPVFTARRYRVGAAVLALIGLSVIAWGALYAIGGQVEPALVFGVAGGIPLLLAWSAYVNSRFLDAATDGLGPEPVRAVCADVRRLLGGGDPPSALVQTDARVAGLRASASGVVEVGSIAIGDIERLDASLTQGLAGLVVHAGDARLAVHRAPASQVYAMLEALREAGVPTGERAGE